MRTPSKATHVESQWGEEKHRTYVEFLLQRGPSIDSHFTCKGYMARHARSFTKTVRQRLFSVFAIYFSSSVSVYCAVQLE